MTRNKPFLIGCVGIPLLLFGSWFAKSTYNSWRYNLPGEILESSLPPSQILATPFKVAEALDNYVQPRFAILRDTNFGIARIIRRQHAGIAQLKVDSPQEKEIIANVNATKRNYAIGFLNCAPLPHMKTNNKSPRLDLFYMNQTKLVKDMFYVSNENKIIAQQNKIDLETAQEAAIKALHQLRKGHELRFEDKLWVMLLRPVLASSSECLNCHKNAKSGETLGVMFYAVRKITRH